ncbi:MAG: hypothetical protein WBF81_07295 [Thermoplasmata archaeon]
MLRTERARLSFAPSMIDAPHTLARDLLIAVAPPPRTHVYDLSGWPNWLMPTYRSGGHRTTRLREEPR